MDNENIIVKVTGKRKGKRNGVQQPCDVMAGYMDDGPEPEVILRTEDVGGISPIVALLTPDDARTLGVALITAAARAD